MITEFIQPFVGDHHLTPAGNIRVAGYLGERIMSVLQQFGFSPEA